MLANKEGQGLTPALIDSAVRGRLRSCLGGSRLELAVELLDQRLAVLVSLLVLADLADLGRREAVELLGDLSDIELVVARDREPAVSPSLHELQPLPVVGERNGD